MIFASPIQVAVQVLIALIALGGVQLVSAATADDVQKRVDADLAEGRPVVIHVVVALCDNVNQGIVPVPEAIGNGQEPSSNLYWGAMYGVRHYLAKKAGWKKVDTPSKNDPRILERAARRKKLSNLPGG